MGDSLLVLVFVAIAGAAAATGVSAVREGHLRARLPNVRVDEDAVDGDEADDRSSAGGTASVGTDPPGDDGPDSEQATPSRPILTDEERVLRTLHEHGGQVKQQRIVSGTDWSKSKVSRLLSRMAEDGEIRKITLGRENVIRLPDERDESHSPAADRARKDRS